LVVCNGDPKECNLSFVEDPNMSTEELKAAFPEAYVVRMRDLMSDSLKRINQLSTQRHLTEVTKTFSKFALDHGIPIDCLADPDHTLPDTMRKILSLEINAKIHHLALTYLDTPKDEDFARIHELIDEAKALDTTFSFGGTGRMFHRKLMGLIENVERNQDEASVRHITGLITIADWLELYIDKTTLENKVFPIYMKFMEDPNGKLAALKPMFDWLNFEVPHA
jgi:hypothetical protein